MIEIAQTGQSGKTHLLFDMHRMRARIFKEKMGWDVHVNEMNMEIDQFDIPEAVYFLALDDDTRQVVGNWRFLPVAGPTMIRDIWPASLDTINMPYCLNSWEATRFGVDVNAPDAKTRMRKTNKAIAELVHALVDTCLSCGISHIYSLYDLKIAKIMKKMGCEPDLKSHSFMVDDLVCEVVRFSITPDLMRSVERATGIKESLIGNIDLPLAILDRLTSRAKRVSHG